MCNASVFENNEFLVQNEKRIQKQGLSMYLEVENLHSMCEALNWISSTGKKIRSDDMGIYFVAERSCMKPTMNYRKREP